LIWKEIKTLVTTRGDPRIVPISKEIRNISERIRGDNFSNPDDSLDGISLALHHEASIFPDETDKIVTFVAGPANTFGAWIEVIDNSAVTLSSKFVNIPGHITAFLVETANATDKIYLFELAYGDSKTILTRYRFIGGAKKSSPIQPVRAQGAQIPAGATIYYRMACEKANATCQLHIRYFLYL